MLERLIKWSPFKFATCLATRLCTDLANPEYHNITQDEVGIMLTPSGMLYNRVLLDNLPRYQTNKVNIKKQSKLYSHDIQLDILEDQIKQKQQQEANAEKETDFLASIATQLTANQLEIVKTEMEKEEEIRKRVSKVNFPPLYTQIKGNVMANHLAFSISSMKKAVT